MRGGDRGFVLVGVVMFVLALTILGLSLYGLSGYESEFATQSGNSSQALYAAEGGLEMVKALLATPPYRLETAKTAIGFEGVTYAVALQRRTGVRYDSTGAVDFSNDSTVTLVVQATANGVSRKLSAQFVPRPRTDWYRRLITSVAGIRCQGVWPGGGPAANRMQTVELSGPTWQGQSSAAWYDTVLWRNGRQDLIHPNVPLPMVADFITAHAGAATLPDSERPMDEGDLQWFFRGPQSENGPPAGVRYFLTPRKRKYPNFDFDQAVSGVNVTLNVSGTCVWLVEHGVRFQNQVKINNTGEGNATLVIVAGPNNTDPTEPDVGIYFFGGLQVQGNVNLVLVSSGAIDVEAFNGWGLNHLAGDVAMFGSRVFLMGPGSAREMELFYTTGRGSVDEAILALEGLDALPRTATAPDGFTLLRGSWRDVTP